eukprot:g81512.t1
MFQQLEKNFHDVIGPLAVEELRKRLTNKPVITIAGDQLTGKSTIGKSVARHFHGSHISTGSFFRAEAARRKISVATLSRQARGDASIDVHIDYNTCLLIASSLPELHDGQPLVLEGRQPAILALYVQRLGKTNIASIFLHCSFPDQAIRLLERECDPESFRHARTHLRKL